MMGQESEPLFILKVAPWPVSGDITLRAKRLVLSSHLTLANALIVEIAFKNVLKMPFLKRTSTVSTEANARSVLNA